MLVPGVQTSDLYTPYYNFQCSNTPIAKVFN